MENMLDPDTVACCFGHEIEAGDTNDDGENMVELWGNYFDPKDYDYEYCPGMCAQYCNKDCLTCRVLETQEETDV